MPPIADRLDARSRQLLRSLVSRYIEGGEPVGSRTLAKASGLEVSPATIRNILSDLEELGLVAAPHTSAGRVPTASGYRVFVDSLIEVRPPDEQLLRQVGGQLPTTAGTQALLSNATELLSAMSQFVGVVTVPQRGAFAFRHIEFLPLDGARVLAVLVFADHEVQNRILATRREFTASELEQSANYLNQHFAGLTWDEIRAGLLRELREARSELERVLSVAAELSEQLQPSTAAEDVLVAGQNRLIGSPDLTDLDRLRELFETFARKRELLGLLDRCAKAPGVRIFIGEETGLAPLDGLALISAPYHAQGRVLGAVGVIGPSRMAYERVIPVVQATADLVGRALNPATASP